MGHFFNDDDPEQALDWYRKAIGTLGALLTREPRLAKGQVFLRNAHWGLAVALGKLKRHAEAVQHWDKVLSLEPESATFRCQRAIALARAGDATLAMAEVNALTELSGLEPGRLYELATACAVASAVVAKPELQEQCAARAVAILRQALARGFKDVQGIKTNPAFAPLGERADFQQLIRQAEGSAR
jgi:tetratricopeptide (TPR) repeat protein